jgi:GDPmannose 4,6-dehydratase
MFVVNGILFNHEGTLRGTEFVTRKVSIAVARIGLGMVDKLSLGNLDAMRDWGNAPDYVESMWLMLQQDTPKDYVIASGEAYSVRDLCRLAFECVGLDWTIHVETAKEHLRPMDVSYLCGDASLAREELGWEPKVKFHQLVELMVTADLRRLSNAHRSTWGIQ